MPPSLCRLHPARPYRRATGPAGATVVAAFDGDDCLCPSTQPHTESRCRAAATCTRTKGSGPMSNALTRRVTLEADAAPALACLRRSLLAVRRALLSCPAACGRHCLSRSEQPRAEDCGAARSRDGEQERERRVQVGGLDP